MCRAGARTALLSNNGAPIYEWNALWAAKTKRVADGWTVEIMIPFRSISYDAKRADWGLDLYRRMYRISERVRWTSAISQVDTFDLTREGTLAGMHDISQGIGLDIQTYASLRYKHEWVAPGREDDEKFAASGNLYYKLTPALTSTLTVNPDFSNTPLDQRKINTTRFALFYPETRDFFLQDAAAFEFGGTPFSTMAATPTACRSSRAMSASSTACRCRSASAASSRARSPASMSAASARSPTVSAPRSGRSCRSRA